jgi:hypothetical protein
MGGAEEGGVIVTKGSWNVDLREAAELRIIWIELALLQSPAHAWHALAYLIARTNYFRADQIRQHRRLQYRSAFTKVSFNTDEAAQRWHQRRSVDSSKACQ